MTIFDLELSTLQSLLDIPESEFVSIFFKYRDSSYTLYYDRGKAGLRWLTDFSELNDYCCFWFSDNKLSYYCSCCPRSTEVCEHIIFTIFQWTKACRALLDHSQSLSDHFPHQLNPAMASQFLADLDEAASTRACSILNFEPILIYHHHYSYIKGLLIENDINLYLNWDLDQTPDKIDCTCFHEKCAHRVAFFLRILLSYNPAINWRYFFPNMTISVKILQYHRFKRDFLFHHAISETAKNISDPTRNYQLFISLKKTADQAMLHIQKSFYLKTGTTGRLIDFPPASLFEDLVAFPEPLQRLIELLVIPRELGVGAGIGGLQGNRLEYALDNQPITSRILERCRDYYRQKPKQYVNITFFENFFPSQVFFHINSSPTNVLSVVIELRFDNSGEIISLTRQNTLVLGLNPEWVIVEQGDQVYAAPVMLTSHYLLKDLTTYFPMEVPYQNFLAFFQKYYEIFHALGKLKLPLEFTIEEIGDIDPHPAVFISNYQNTIGIELKFSYNEQWIYYYNSNDFLLYRDEERMIAIRRKRAAEDEYYAILAETGAVPQDRLLIPRHDPVEWIADELPRLHEKGFDIYGQNDLQYYRIHPAKPKLKMQLTSGINWFDLQLNVQFGEESIAVESIIQALDQHHRYIKLSDGRLGIIPKNWLQKLSGILGFLKKAPEEGKYRANFGHFELLEAICTIADYVESDPAYLRMRELVNNYTENFHVALPKNFSGILRPYQQAGYQWLHFLRHYGLGGCLADEMGLGKTVQALSILLYEKEQGNQLSSLIIVPTSLMFNWLEEINKFVPSLRVISYHGTGRIFPWGTTQRPDCDLIITTYGILRNDIADFSKIQFNYAILDEAQIIKNPTSLAALAVCQLNARHRLALTGTPIENNLLELWSLFKFTNPGLLGRLDYFRDHFVRQIERQEDQSAREALKRLVKPFILLRKKEDVATELPPKQIMTTRVDMTPEQEALYREYLQQSRSILQDASQRNRLKKNKFEILQALMRLRQIANHPRLVYKDYRHGSGKFEMMTRQWDEIIAEGHKILIFSAFVKFLKIIRAHFVQFDIPFAYIDGSTRNRAEQVQRFQHDPDCPVFLLSLKAGGLGLNLTAADYVFIIDPWWNPAVEMQAIDRAHRIGQTRPIMVYKMISRNTIEEHIVELQQKKLILVQEIIPASQILNYFNSEELIGLIEA